jgi:hypothetical protein
MSNKGVAYVIASAIYAGNREAEKIDTEEVSERLYCALTVLVQQGWTDEFKAELYAHLAETLKADTPFEQAVSIIEQKVRELNTYV